MPKKDYILIASAVAHQRAMVRSNNGDDHAERHAGLRALTGLACLLADQLEQENPRFNRARFLDACDVTPLVP